MTDRRRNVLILLLVAGLLAASAVVLATRDTKLGLDLQGGVSLIYEANPTIAAPTVTGEAVDNSIDIMRERVDRLGVAEPEIQRVGADQIEVQLPGADNVQAAIDQVGTTAQLYFYDWEKNVLNAQCETDPSDASVTGGQAAGQPGAGTIPYYGAVIRASRCDDFKPDDNDTHAGLLFGVDDDAQTVTCGPQVITQPSEEEAARESLREECAGNAERFRESREGPTGKLDRIIEVPRGVNVVQAEGPDDPQSNEERRLARLAENAFYVIKDDPALKGTDIKDPSQQFDQTAGSPNVTFEFTDRGADVWQDVTREIAQRGQDSFFGGNKQDAVQHFAIVLDDELISVPFIDFQRNPDGIDGSTGSEISGGFTIQSAQNLADLLRTGALPLRLDLISQSQVSATLGRQALDQGIIAGIAGFTIVALFLLVFYRVLGVIAVAGLAVYGLYFYALIKLIPITLTLPGLAGLILTLGVAADANIVIFERVKEEIRAGRSVIQGILQGYKRGISAIIDANVVTFMVAFILFILATAGVKGFAFTLGVGTLVSLFTAVLATQAALGTMQRSRFIRSPSALGAKEQKSKITIDFMGKSKFFFALSGLILLVCAFALAGKGLNFGIDFESGSRIKTTLAERPSEGQLRDVLTQAGFENPEIQRITGDSELGGDGYQISLGETGEEVAQVRPLLEREFGGAQAFQSSSIGPTFGETVAESAIIAIIASLIVISAYIALRFEWKYAVPVLIAVMHDILITGGVYALLGQEITTATVAALLTILGFSLYDTIIVFDRIRENVPRMPRAAFTQIVNRSMSEVIIRSLATSFCTALPVLALMLFGGETLQAFAFALLVGTISGTYSSVFIAGPVLAHWKEAEPMFRRRRAKIMAENGGVVPPYAAEGKLDLQERKRRSARLTSPDDPERRVSASEFQDLVADIQDTAAEVEGRPAAAGTAEAERPAPAPAPPRSSTEDARPEDLVMKDDRKPKSKRPPKRGRKR
jgi:SecD/SecF fusion protein